MSRDQATLLSAAHAQWQRARTLCTVDCRDYHTAWPFLRAAGLVGGIDADKLALSAVLSPLLSKQGGHILIAGSADDAQLQLVQELAGDVPCNITVVDRCATPLAACESHRASSRYGLTTETMDLLSFAPENKFDVILCHSLLPFLKAEDRKKLLGQLTHWLTPFGSLVLAVKLDPDQAGQQTAIDSAHWVRGKAAMASEALDALTAITPKERHNLNQSVEGFYRYMAQNPIPYRHVDDVVGECLTAGLQVLETRLAGLGHGFPGAHARTSLQSIVIHAKPATHSKP